MGRERESKTREGQEEKQKHKLKSKALQGGGERTHGSLRCKSVKIRNDCYAYKT